MLGNYEYLYFKKFYMSFGKIILRSSKWISNISSRSRTPREINA
jgi:hypothetical protein